MSKKPLLSERCLFIGGPADGRVIAVNLNAAKWRIVVKGTDHTVVDYFPQLWAADENYGTRIFAVDGMTQRQVLKALLDNYRPDVAPIRSEEPEKSPIGDFAGLN